MSAFTEAELDYLTSDERRIARIATADPAAHPQVTPVGMWRYNPETDTIDVTGRNFVTTRKYRNVASNPSAAFVVDDIASIDPWQPRAVIVEGSAQAIAEANQTNGGVIRITPERVISWGIEGRPDA